MPFIFLPVVVGNDITAPQFNEARDAVLERADMAGTGSFVGPAVAVGDTLLRSPGTIQINSLRIAIEQIITSAPAFDFVDPSTGFAWASLTAFFTAAGIGDGTNWTRVPARKGGLTVSTRLALGDVVFVEHINEIRLAVLILTRIIWNFSQFQEEWNKAPVPIVGPVWTTVRAAAIASLAGQAPTTGLGIVRVGFEGSGSNVGGGNVRATVVTRRGFSLQSAGGLIGAAAPTPLTYANVSVRIGAQNSAFTNAPPPSATSFVGRIGSPSSSFVNPATLASWLQGTPWVNFGYVSGFQFDAPTPALLPDGVADPAVSFFLNWGVDEVTDRTAWPPPSSSSFQFLENQVAPVLSSVIVSADVTSWTFI